jgi:hypothetical protein
LVGDRAEDVFFVVMPDPLSEQIHIIPSIKKIIGSG